MLSDAKAQGTTPASEASQVAQKMMDFLLLSGLQRSQIEAVTLDIQTMKVRLRLRSDLIDGTEVFNVQSDGTVGINITDTKNYKLAVNRSAIFTKAVVMNYSTWSGYVFDESYKLPTLQEVAAFIRFNKHLPGIPITAEVEKNGIDLGDNQVLLLKKLKN